MTYLVGFLKNLQEQDRQILSCFYIENMEVDDIAELFGVQGWWVRMLLHAARKNSQISVDATYTSS